MGEEKIDVIEPEEFKTPQVSTGLQAFSLIVAGISFYWTNYRKSTIFILVALFAVALILYNNVNVLREIYSIVPGQ
jgi:hypothetical protein